MGGSCPNSAIGWWRASARGDLALRLPRLDHDAVETGRSPDCSVSMSPAAVVDQLRDLALRSGADALGVTDARPVPEAKDAIQDRKDRNLHAGMVFTFGNPKRSSDPGLILDGARSVVVLLRRYVGRREVHDPDRAPLVGRYVQEDEYGALRGALNAVAHRLTELGWRSEVVMDDNRLADRSVAARAGLGWFGRNTMLLNAQLGSWTVIGSVVTDALLPVTGNGPADDGCGACRRCQVACPTGALEEAGVLDARRCLAWLVQAAGQFPPEFRVALGARLYGCDDCQEVCPVNDPVEAVPVQVSAPPRHRPHDVVEVLGHSDEELMATFGHWYVPRRRAEYLRRNALIVLANIGDPADPGTVEAVRTALGSSSVVVRSHAIWTARRLGLGHLVDLAVDGPGFADDQGVVAGELALSTPRRADL